MILAKEWQLKASLNNNNHYCTLQSSDNFVAIIWHMVQCNRASIIKVAAIFLCSDLKGIAKPHFLMPVCQVLVQSQWK